MGGWETFLFKGKTATPKLTIRKGGQIGLNSYAVDKFGLSKYKYVLLRINKEEKKIGVQPTNDETQKGIQKLKIIQGTGTISAKKFIGYYEIKNLLGEKFECEWDGKEKMVIAKY